MKQKLITTILIWLITQTMSLGQCQEDETISTNPNNPKNTELPSSRLQYKNQFNWAKTTTHNSVAVIPINSAANWDRSFIPSGSTFNMTSPFTSFMDDEYRYLYQKPGINPAELDWHWQDGWELIWVNLGWYPDNITTISTNPAHRTSPYFVLYNRYTGKLRFFGNHFQQMGISNTAQNIDLNIHMSSHNKSGIFRHVGNYDQALDQKTKFWNLYSNNKHPNDNGRFYSTDFQLGYDPCMCHYESALTFHVQENANWNVNLTGRSITMNSSINDYPPGFLTNRTWMEDSLTADFGGSLIYKNFSDLNDKYEKELTEYEKKLATYNKPQNLVYREIINLSKDLVKNGVPTAAMPFVGPGIRSMVKTFMKNYPGSYDEDNPKELAKGIIKTADGVLGRGFDYLVKQYINPDIVSKPVKPTMPSASFSEMVIGGSISHSKNYKLFETAAPGSFDVASNTFDVFNYPIYNKPTGLYALLKTPRLSFGNFVGAVNEKNVISEPTIDLERDWTIIQLFGTFNGFLHNRHERVVSRTKVFGKHDVSQDIVFKLDEQLLYKLNRNLDINNDKTNILVSFQVELEGNLPSKFHNNNTVLNEKRLEVDISQSNFEILHHESHVSSNEREKIVLEIPWTKIDNTFKHLYGGRVNLTAHYEIGTLDLKQIVIANTVTQNILRSWSELEFIHNTEGLGKFNEETKEVEPLSRSAEVATTIKSIKMKVLTDITFDQLSSKGGELNTTQVFTYLLYDKDKNIDLIESKGRWLSNSETENLSKSASSTPILTLTNEHITPNSTYVSFTKGNELWIRADEVHVVGNTTVMPGLKVILFLTKGGNGVKLFPGAKLNPDIQIRFGDKYERYPWNNLTFEATNNQVNSFCSNKNTEYKANQSNASMIPKDTEDVENTEEVIPELPTETNNSLPNPSQIFPNPNNGNFMVAFERVLDVDGELTLADFSGRIIQTEQLKKGTSRFQVVAHNLSSGIYFATISHKGQKSTHKVMVSRE